MSPDKLLKVRTVRCPQCAATSPGTFLTGDVASKTVQCPACRQRFAVPGLLELISEAREQVLLQNKVRVIRSAKLLLQGGTVLLGLGTMVERGWPAFLPTAPGPATFLIGLGGAAAAIGSLMAVGTLATPGLARQKRWLLPWLIAALWMLLVAIRPLLVGWLRWLR